MGDQTPYDMLIHTMTVYTPIKVQAQLGKEIVASPTKRSFPCWVHEVEGTEIGSGGGTRGIRTATVDCAPEDAPTQNQEVTYDGSDWFITSVPTNRDGQGILTRFSIVSGK
jgi:hypothetical protein